MSKAFHGFLLCSALAVPFLGSTSARAATFVNFEGGCLTDLFGDTANGNPIGVIPCFATFAQKWRWEGLEIRGLVSREGVATCVTRVGGDNLGSPVQLFQCNGSFSQQWKYNNGRIKSPFSGLCLDVGDGSTLTQATMRICNFALAATGQRWFLRSVQFENDNDTTGAPSCVDVRGANTANGTPVQGFPCNATPAQDWNWEELAIQGIGSTGAGAKCLDVVGGGTADNTLVQLFDCNGTGAQQWRYDKGRIINLRSNKCLTIFGGVVRQMVIDACGPSFGFTQRFSIR